VTKAFDGTHFHETVLQLEHGSDKTAAADILSALMEKGILGGFDLSQDYPELGNAILVCTTEMRNEDDIETYVRAMQEILTSQENSSDDSKTSSVVRAARVRHNHR